uniref:mitogen-activated protein kinase kinase n=2 Tax=Oryza sativa subsp. japonica TaxID=39947 RepID=Q8W318_ORYSJ|nr:mitogen-activated protein kinase kinase 9 [Oryza sativa Japonica Group]AAL58223.1 putative kinase [Oryza sativa Japonica Group]ABF98535.1 Protein kinase domain containing protein [Oryza sativa Japonica Group]
MALIREKRFSQMNLSLHVPSRVPFQDAAAAARRQCPPPVAAASTSSTPASRASQFRLADFERVAVLGRGNGGTVYKVRHRETCALYALKVQHSAGGGELAGVEADILSRTASPFVVRCHAVLPASASASGDVALLLELVDGGSLASVAARAGAFPEAAVAEVAAQALSGLACLHARRVVHRDIKPGNLLVSVDGEVKIADFGIAKVVPPRRGGEHRAAYEYEGTAAYMSPERFDSELHGDGADPFAADVWGLGVTVLELLMARYPLLPAGQKPSWAALMCAICFGELPPLPDGAASPELRAFLAACLHKDHTKRPSAAHLLTHQFVAGRNVAASKLALRRLVAGA